MIHKNLNESFKEMVLFPIFINTKDLVREIETKGIREEKRDEIISLLNDAGVKITSNSKYHHLLRVF